MRFVRVVVAFFLVLGLLPALLSAQPASAGPGGPVPYQFIAKVTTEGLGRAPLGSEWSFYKTWRVQPVIATAAW